MRYLLVAFAVIAAGSVTAQTPPWTRAQPPLQWQPDSKVWEFTPEEYGQLLKKRKLPDAYAFQTPERFAFQAPDTFAFQDPRQGPKTAPDGKVCRIARLDPCVVGPGVLVREPYRPGTADFYELEKPSG